MFEWLFPHWSNRSVLVMVVGGRTFFNIALTAVVATSVGTRMILTGLAAIGTVVSAVMMVLLLRPGVLGVRASNVELLVQLVLLVIVGYAIYSNPSAGRVIAGAVVVVGALVLFVFMIPVYGEAFVAP